MMRCVFRLVNHHWQCSIGLFILLIAAAGARADSVTLTPSADTTLIQTAPNNNAGAQTYFNSGTTQNNTQNRGLIQFDLSSLPQNAEITSATLLLNVTGQPKDGYTASLFQLHRVLVSWGEGNKTGTQASPGQGAPATAGEATWNDRFALQGLPWSAPGGAAGVDYVAASSAEQAVFDVGSSPYAFGSTAMLVSDVQTWVNDPGQNHGWMLISSAEDQTFTARRFGSREDANNAPLLTIDFVVVPEPGTTAMFIASGSVLFVGLRQRKRARG